MRGGVRLEPCQITVLFTFDKDFPYSAIREILTKIPKIALKKFRWIQKVRKKTKKVETFSLAKYHLGLVEKPYGNSQNHPRKGRPRFLSQNVEYVPFIDRAPHIPVLE